MSIKYRKLKNNFGAMWSAAAVPTVHYTDYNTLTNLDHNSPHVSSNTSLHILQTIFSF